MSTGATFTLTEASKQCRRQNTSGQWSSVSRKTLQRALDRDEFPNAFRADGPAGEGSGPWIIPKDDLIGAGFIPGGGRTNTEPDTAPATSTEPGTTPDEVVDLAARLAKAETDAAEYRRRAEVAEAIADERRKALEDTRLALRALTEGTTEKAPAENASVASVVTREGGNTRPLRDRLKRFTRG